MSSGAAGFDFLAGLLGNARKTLGRDVCPYHQPGVATHTLAPQDPPLSWAKPLPLLTGSLLPSEMSSTVSRAPAPMPISLGSCLRAEGRHTAPFHKDRKGHEVVRSADDWNSCRRRPGTYRAPPATLSSQLCCAPPGLCIPRVQHLGTA